MRICDSYDTCFGGREVSVYLWMCKHLPRYIHSAINVPECEFYHKRKEYSVFLYQSNELWRGDKTVLSDLRRLKYNEFK